MSRTDAGAPNSWSPPSRFDDYRLVRRLGQGGMGEVYLGHDEMLDRPVALKFVGVRTGAEQDPRSSERLLSEARALAKVHHQHVAGVYRAGVVANRPYIAYEFIDGTSLDELELPLPWRQVVELGLAMGRGLAAVHGHGLLHRDIKPSNVMLARSGAVKLIDFGLARALQAASVEREVQPPEAAPEDAGTAPVHRSAIRGVIAGTPPYLAPELWQGAEPSERSDLFAMGLTLYELLAGELPHADLSIPTLAAQLVLYDLPSLEARCPEAPPALLDLIHRLIQRDPSQRFATAEQVCDALQVVRSLYQPFLPASSHAEELRTRAPAATDVLPPDEPTLLAESYARVHARLPLLAQKLYENLFAEQPALRALFPAELSGQQSKLASALDLVLRELHRPERLVLILEDLGRRHADYEVEAHHFEAVGRALLLGLRDLEGAGWHSRLEQAWAHAYQRIAQVMVRGLVSARAQRAATLEVTPPTLGDLPVGVPETHYARNGEVSIAYQTLGHGPLDLVVVPGFVSHLELSWEHPSYASFLRKLAAFSRIILIDRRGTGLSDRVSQLSLDAQVADLVSVLDAAGVDRAGFFGMSGGGVLSLLFAAIHPDRVRALAVSGCGAKTLQSEDYPHGVPAEAMEQALLAIRSGWGGPLFVEGLAPTLAADPAFRDWWARYLRSSASPASAEAILRNLTQIDTRDFLDCIEVPTLVIHREGDMMSPLAGARYLSEALSHAELRTLSGSDHLPFVGDSDALVARVNEFLMSAAPVPVQGSLRTVVGACWDEDGASGTSLARLERAARNAGGEPHAPARGDTEGAAFAFQSVKDALEFAEALTGDPALRGARAAVATGGVPARGSSPLGEWAVQQAQLLPPGVVAVGRLPWLLAFGTTNEERAPFRRWREAPSG